MTIDTHEDSAKTLREFLLSQALVGQLEDGILQEALATIKLPAGKRNVAQQVQAELLEAWQSGDIGKDEFLAAWRRVGGKAQDRETGGGKIEGWMPLVVFLALALSALSSWVGYELWLSSRPEPPPSQVAAPQKPVAQPAPLPETSYQDNTVRAYVSEGFALADMARTAVAEYYMSMGVYPRDNAQAGLAQPQDMRGNAVSSVAVGEGGIITVTFNQFVGEGQTLVLEPTSSGGGPIVWDCKKGTLPARHRPPHCR